MVKRKTKTLFEFDDSFQANRCYTILKEKVRGGRVGLSDLDRVFKELCGHTYKSEIPALTWRDWAFAIQPEDLLLRVYNNDYATIYIREHEEEAKPELKFDLEDFKDILEVEIDNCIKKVSNDHPEFKMDDVLGSYIMLKIKANPVTDRGQSYVKSMIIFKEVKE